MLIEAERRDIRPDLITFAHHGGERQGPIHEVIHVCTGCLWLTGNPERQYPGYTCRHHDAQHVFGPGSLEIKGYIGDRPVTPHWCPCFSNHMENP